jgi:ubiquinone/menaquinone biosynthesis C-methylase UbiE
VYLDGSKVHHAFFVGWAVKSSIRYTRARGVLSEKEGGFPMSDTELGRQAYAQDVTATTATRARYNRLAPIYDLMDGLSERLSTRFKRQKLWSLVPAGQILEIGVGTGKNMPYYPSGARVTAIDLSDKMLAQARKRAASENIDVTLHEMDVQDLEFKENSFDTAVATWVFCSVPDPVCGLRELGRVVRPEGRLVLLDHMRVDRPIIGRLMDWLNPLVVWATGANINRRTVDNVRRAGLIVESVKDLTTGGTVKLIVARPRPAPGPRLTS